MAKEGFEVFVNENKTEAVIKFKTKDLGSLPKDHPLSILVNGLAVTVPILSEAISQTAPETKNFTKVEPAQTKAPDTPDTPENRWEKLYSVIKSNPEITPELIAEIKAFKTRYAQSKAVGITGQVFDMPVEKVTKIAAEVITFAKENRI